MKAGAACSTVYNSGEAGKKAAEKAVEVSGEPVLTFLFTTEYHDHKAVLDSVKRVVGRSKIVGFCSAGIIASGKVHRQAVGVCTLSGDEIRANTTLHAGLSGNSFLAGARVADEILSGGFDSGSVFIFPDGLTANVPELLRGLYRRMGPAFKYVGCCAGDNLKYSRTYQFTEKGIEEDAVAVVVLDGIEIESALGHGCNPAGEPLIITRAKGKRVFEINGRSALDFYCEMMGSIPPGRFADYAMRYPLGFPDIAGNYLIRDPVAANPDGSIDFITEIPDKSVGSIMSQVPEDMISAAWEAADNSVRNMAHPEWMLLFDCISRYLLMGADYEKELQVINARDGREPPFLGVLTFGNIGGFTEVPQFHRQTAQIIAAGRMDGENGGFAE
ncbi:MAG: FIST signal transduction protein [Syntrophales bacterium]